MERLAVVRARQDVVVVVVALDQGRLERSSTPPRSQVIWPWGSVKRAVMPVSQKSPSTASRPSVVRSTLPTPVATTLASASRLPGQGCGLLLLDAAGQSGGQREQDGPGQRGVRKGVRELRACIARMLGKSPPRAMTLGAPAEPAERQQKVGPVV